MAPCSVPSTTLRAGFAGAAMRHHGPHLRAAPTVDPGRDGGMASFSRTSECPVGPSQYRTQAELAGALTEQMAVWERRAFASSMLRRCRRGSHRCRPRCPTSPSIFRAGSADVCDPDDGKSTLSGYELLLTWTTVRLSFAFSASSSSRKVIESSPCCRRAGSRAVYRPGRQTCGSGSSLASRRRRRRSTRAYPSDCRSAATGGMGRRSTIAGGR